MREVRKAFVGGCFAALGLIVVDVVALVVLAIGASIVFRGAIDKAMLDPQAAGWESFLQHGDVPPGQPIGTTQKVGDAEVTVHGVRESQGNEYLTPGAGNKWLFVDVSARNAGNDPYTLSSLLQCRLRDSEGRDYFAVIGPPIPAPFDGMIPVAGAIQGEVPFEVPSTASGLVFVFGQVFGTGRASWALP
jgi:hypothetical protein